MSDTSLDFIRQIIADDLQSGKHESIVTRFPPEPNGYLHIGHAKAICLSFGVAQENEGARCNLRFDDTNPAKEEAEYVESIKSDVSWLGFDWGENLYFASNYFDFFYDCACHLIKEGLAYIDEQTGDQIKENRGNVKIPGTASPYRDRPAEESLDLFSRMKSGEFEEGKMVLRAKIDMGSWNMNMRDPILYRILHVEHHHTGDLWKIYPMYDFAHPLEDAFEHITHSLCTLEFENHRPLYEWVVDHCPVPATPRQIEFARLNLTYTVMSKRKLLQLVEEKVVAGWDDPRLPTISGLRRRGYPAAAIQSFCKVVGITKQNSMTDVALLEYEVRSNLNAKASRKMGVLKPLKIVLTNYPEGQVEMMTVPNHPEHEEAGVREVPLARELYIERDDFMIDPPKKYFRLAPGNAVRLRGGYIIQYTGHTVDEATGEVTEVQCEFIPDTVGQSAPEGVKCRTAIHWVSVAHAKDAEIRLYDRLFTDENPDKNEAGFLACLNPNSLEIITNAKVEPSLAEAAPESVFQFERLGYFCADSKDHSSASLVFNRTVGLRDSWGKKK